MILREYWVYRVESSSDLIPAAEELLMLRASRNTIHEIGPPLWYVMWP
jgi:hypothetical protein